MKQVAAPGFDLISRDDLEDKGADAAASKKLPLQINSAIMVYDATNPANRAKSKVLGAVEPDYIIIERPVFTISDRLSAVVECDYSCTYLHDGYLYKFISKQNREFAKNIICIDYPREFEVIRLRKHRRIKVSVEARFEHSESGQPVRASIRDISEGGCLLMLPTILHFGKGTPVIVTFKLPNDQVVEKVQCTVMNIQQVYIRQYTAIGLSFGGPPEEIEKVRAFCEFCKRFRA